MAVAAHPRVRGYPCATIPFHVLVVVPVAKLVADSPEREPFLGRSTPPLQERVRDGAARIQANNGRVHLRHLHRLVATEPQRAERLVARPLAYPVMSIPEKDVAVPLDLVEDRSERAYCDARGIEPQQQLAAVLSRLLKTVRLEGKGDIHMRRR